MKFDSETCNPYFCIKILNWLKSIFFTYFFIFQGCREERPLATIASLRYDMSHCLHSSGSRGGSGGRDPPPRSRRDDLFLQCFPLILGVRPFPFSEVKFQIMMYNEVGHPPPIPFPNSWISPCCTHTHAWIQCLKLKQNMSNIFQNMFPKRASRPPPPAPHAGSTSLLNHDNNLDNFII